MASRWGDEETNALKEVNSRLGDELKKCPSFGDRKLIQFIRGHDMKIEKVCQMVKDSLKWREENNLEQIRANLLEKGWDNPMQFPNGDIIMENTQLFVAHPDIVDKAGEPVTVEGIIPPTLWEVVSPEDFITFRLYCLEYVVLLLDNISDAKEAQNLTNGISPYGHCRQLLSIRNLAGMSISQFAGVTKATASKLLKLSSDNYPELLKKAVMINAPWVFTTVWAILKLFLAQRTIDNVSILGSNYSTVLEELTDLSSMPPFIDGGTFESFKNVRCKAIQNRRNARIRGTQSYSS